MGTYEESGLDLPDEDILESGDESELAVKERVGSGRGDETKRLCWLVSEVGPNHESEMEGEGRGESVVCRGCEIPGRGRKTQLAVSFLSSSPSPSLSIESTMDASASEALFSSSSDTPGQSPKPEANAAASSTEPSKEDKPAVSLASLESEVNQVMGSLRGFWGRASKQVSPSPCPHVEHKLSQR
jgi:hypothetical protein